MYSLSDRFLLLLPACMAMLFILLGAVPVTLGQVTLTPNAAWLMTIAMAVLYPPSWPFWLPFLLGLVQDILYGIPLGSQALLGLLLWLALRARPPRVSHPLFRIVWAEAALLMVFWHAGLWLMLVWVQPMHPPLTPLLMTGVVNALWFPVFYWPALGIASLLPAR